jgi:Domain of unknown function (DUF2017)
VPRKSRPAGPPGSVVISLSEVEVAVLGGLIDELDALATDPPADDPVTDRLYPPGYDDDAAARDFSDLTRPSLQRERRERYEQCRAQLPIGGGELVIAAESVQSWLVVLNDMRLALGTRLGVTPEGFADAAGGPDVADDVNAARIAYQWLTAIQDQLVTSVMR